MRLAVIVFCLSGLPATGDGLDDRHLAVIPRDADEQAQVAAATALTNDFSRPEASEAMAGGAATVPARADADAFSLASANLSAAGQGDFQRGNALFRKAWVAAPAVTRAADGLGPLYNARTCQECHINDGRGQPPQGPEEQPVSMVLRLSVPGAAGDAGIADWLASLPDPSYGQQLQQHAAPGQPPEGRFAVSYRTEQVTLADGTVVLLQAPSYTISDLGHGPLSPDLMISPRVAPQMIGLGLLEAIPAAEILLRADPTDSDGDGISGRAQIVPSREQGVPMLGRFGLKAGAPTIRDQSAAAFSQDMGLSTPLHPDPWGDCQPAQTACRLAEHGQEPGVRDGVEVDGQSLDLVTFYARNLGVPARRRADAPQVLRGKAVFHALNCTGCHQPKQMTHRLRGQPEQSFQLIWPYSDLLLHDMGPGLADNRPEGRASGREWRTPPLWGIGLSAQVTGHSRFLHDGRARDLLEAVLWHGGEAQAARDAVIGLPTADRQALIAFLQSL